MRIDPDQSADLSALHQLVARGILHPLFEDSTALILVVDAETLRIVAVNAAARRAIGTGMRALQTQFLHDVFPIDPPDRMSHFMQAVARARRRQIRFRVAAPLNGGQIFDVDILKINETLPSFVIQARDVTETVRALETADRAEERLLTAIDALSDGFALFDAEDRLVICNETYRHYYPESADAMVPGTPFIDILRHGLQNGQYAEAIGREDAWLADRMDRHLNSPGIVEQKLSNGRWLRIMERPTSDGGRVGLRIDISTLKEQQDALRRLAITDELTGLRNRRNLLEDIALMTQRLQPGQVVSIFHLDLDRFKAVNDIYGHDAGDHLLKHTAAILESALLPGDFTARMGGDEFIVVRRMVDDRNRMRDFAHELIDRISEPVGFGGQFLHVGASIGIASFATMCVGGAQATVLTTADLALYEAKKLGGVAVFYEADMRDRLISDNDIAREVQTGLERQEFEAYFQPQIDARTGRCIGFEALLRWNHPRDGVLAAGKFLAIAQRAALADTLDTLMMNEACRCLQWLQAMGHVDVSVSINMSTAQLSDPRLLDRLEAALATYGVPRHLLHVELLESTLLDERTAHFLANVQAMVEAGFVVELDDFGTGHAAIAALRKFRVSRIKIDRSFVRYIDQDQELQKLTGAIVGMANSLDIGVLAEGVETQAEQDWLLRSGCPLAQGWLYGPAVPMARIGSFLPGPARPIPAEACPRNRCGASSG